jgi:hypothetical protein
MVIQIVAVSYFRKKEKNTYLSLEAGNRCFDQRVPKKLIEKL